MLSAVAFRYPMTDPASLYDQLNAAFTQRAWPQTLALAQQLLPLAPKHPGVHYMAGVANMEMRDLARAVAHLQRATVLEPRRVEILTQFAKALVLSRRNRDARVIADQAMKLAPKDPATLDTLGVILTQVGEYSTAAIVFRQAAALAPQRASFRFNFATSLIAAGDIDAAEIELEACVTIDPQHWLAHLTLAQLRRQRADSNHVQRLHLLLDGLDGDRDDSEALMCLNMALAKEYEDLGDYGKSFEYLSRGKAAGARGRQYMTRRDEALFSAIIAQFSEPSTPDTSEGFSSDEPIFIIGMPRSGTTLVERIISSHPDVQAAGELLNFGMTLKHVSGCRTPALIDEKTIRSAGQPDWRKLGEAYLSSTRPGTGQKPHFIDKLPHNFLYAGYIAKALPNAKIVCLRRDPMDTCLSNFRQLFAPKSPFFDYSFDLLDTGRYYLLFDRLMAHWQNMFPGRILELDYEEIVDSQAATSRRLLEHCGLYWHDACLQFERNPSPVATASAVQVRAPIYRSSMQRWKRYGSRLQPLRELLNAGGITVDKID